METLSGQQMGQYVLQDQIGEGGMAIVYRAVQPSINREVAIKVLPRHLVERNPQFLDRFYREVQIAAQLQHPHIVPIHDFGEHDGLPYIVMAYLSGGSLADWLKGYGALELDAVSAVLQQIGTALDFAHQRGVVHRDFKPGNILFDAMGNAYLTDFGLAKIQGAEAITLTDTMIGTPDYIAPDWSEEEEPTASVDIYAMAITIYQMLTGVVPYKSSTPMGVLMAHLSQPIPDICIARPDLSDEISAVIQCGMAKTAEERYSSVMEFVGDFNNALLAPAEEFPAEEAEERVTAPEYYYPNVWGLSSILAIEQVLGHEILEQVLVQADLTQYLENYPPENMKRAFPFDHFSRLWQALYQVYGQRGASAVAKAAGAKTFEDALKRFGIIAKVSRAAFDAAPLSTRLRIGLEFVARYFNNLSDQRVEIQEAEDHWIYRITRCPVCWGWHAEEPVCFVAIGLLQASFAWMDGQQRRIVETECIAKGDEACIFRIDKDSMPIA